MLDEIYFDETTSEIREMVRRLAADHITPLAEECDAEDRFPSELLPILSEAGLLTLPMPEEYGGINASAQVLSVVLEEMGYAYATMGPVLLSTYSPLKIVAEAGKPHQKEAFFKSMISKPSIAAFCLSEPHCGSDARAMKTMAVKKGDQWQINGTKRWITNGGVADWYLLFSRTGKGKNDFAVFVVHKDMKGLSFGKQEKKMGLKGGPICDVIFEDVLVPDECLIGEVGDGWKILDGVANAMRCWGAAAITLGIGRAAYDIAAAYANERQAFGQSIARFQGVGFMLADMATSLRASQLLVRDTNWRVDRELPTVSYQTLSQVGMAKIQATDTAMKITTDAVQILGGYGYMREYHVERMMRDAKAFQILDGSNQIQRHILSREIVKSFS